MSKVHGEHLHDLDHVLQTLDRATQRFVERDPSALKSLFSRQDDVTIAGGLGGIERGWKHVGARLDRVSAHYQPARYKADRIAVHRTADLAVVVQEERFEWPAAPGGGAETKAYRATIVLRREDGAWRVVHRHADALIEDRSPR